MRIIQIIIVSALCGAGAYHLYIQSAQSTDLVEARLRTEELSEQVGASMRDLVLFEKEIDKKDKDFEEKNKSLEWLLGEETDPYVIIRTQEEQINTLKLRVNVVTVERDALILKLKDSNKRTQQALKEVNDSYRREATMRKNELAYKIGLGVGIGASFIIGGVIGWQIHAKLPVVVRTIK